MLFASTAPAASTGGLTDSPPRTPCDPRPVADRSGMLDRRGATDDRADAARLEPHRARTCRSDRRPPAGCTASGCRRRRRDFGPAHHAIAIANLELAIDGLIDQHRAARRRPLTLPLELQQPIVVAHDPVIGDRAFLLEAEDLVQRHAPRDGHVEVVRRRRRLRKAPIVVGPVLRVEKRIRRRRRRQCLSAAASSPADPDASRGCARSGPWPAASSPG